MTDARGHARAKRELGPALFGSHDFSLVLLLTRLVSLLSVPG